MDFSTFITHRFPFIFGWRRILKIWSEINRHRHIFVQGQRWVIAALVNVIKRNTLALPIFEI